MAHQDGIARPGDTVALKDGEDAVEEHDHPGRRLRIAEALEQAYVRLGDRDPEAEDLAAQFAEREQCERVAKEFEELKRRVEPND